MRLLYTPAGFVLLLVLYLSASLPVLKKNNNVFYAVSSIKTMHCATDTSNDIMVQLSVGYPFNKNDVKYFVYVNKQMVAKIVPGERVIIQIDKEDIYRVCILDVQTYKDPITQASNSRTMRMKPGKAYYFYISGKGSLEYIFSPESGAKAFNKSGEYKPAAPLLITPSQTGKIPSL